jgi:hypothetical protein
MSKRWQKKPLWLRDAGFTGLTAASRGVFVSVFELLADDNQLSATMAVWSRWTGIDRKTLAASFDAIAKSGLLIVQNGPDSIITITRPDTDLTPTLPKGDTKVIQTSSRPDTDLTPTSSRPDTKVIPTSSKGDPDLIPTSSKGDPDLTPQECSNDGGLRHLNSPLEENRIEENRIEENRKEENERRREEKESKRARPHAEILDLKFSEFWLSHPGKGSKLKAKQMWDKIVESDDMAKDVIEAVEQQVIQREAARRAGAWVPEWRHASTWLNQVGWLDEPIQFKQPERKMHHGDVVRATLASWLAEGEQN